jgi:hypothetical protein
VCLRFRVRGALSVCGRQSTRHPRTVREEPIDRVFVVFFTSSCMPFGRSILSVDFLVHEVRVWSVLECRTVRVGTDGPRVHRIRSVIEGAIPEVWGLFLDGLPQTVRLGLADGPPHPYRQSARCLAELLSLLLLGLLFHLGIIWGLFLGLVGPL